MAAKPRSTAYPPGPRGSRTRADATVWTGWARVARRIPNIISVEGRPARPGRGGLASVDRVNRPGRATEVSNPDDIPSVRTTVGRPALDDGNAQPADVATESPTDEASDRLTQPVDAESPPRLPFPV